jgi:NADH-quinone oxidoreductase subunit J
LRNLVHCALCLAITFAGLAAVYLQLDAQFVGFAQILVYVGAVAILIVFAILLTRSDTVPSAPIVSSSWWIGLGVALATMACLSGAILSSSVVKRSATEAPKITVQQIGAKLLMEHPRTEGPVGLQIMGENFVLPFEVIGLLLTVAMIGAVIIARQERRTQ